MNKHDDDRLEKELQKIEGKPVKPPAVAPENPRIASVQLPDKPCTYEEWQNVIKDNFPDLLFSAEICLSIIVQLLIKDISNPFALVLVDVPSAGKTITLNFFAGLEDLTYATDKFTPASFVSNAANVKKADLPKVDLLPRIKNKGLIVRDFATIFSKREDDLNDLLGTLTRVLDGEGLNTDSGVHGQRHYDGNYLFMMLAASTPVPPKVWKMMGNLGSRLFFLNLNTADKSDDELASQLGATTYKDRERACQSVTHRLLQTLWAENADGVDWQSNPGDRELKLVIARSARLLASLRGVVNIYTEYDENHKPQQSYSSPVIEKPDRINQLLYNLARGHAVACGRRKLSIDDVRFAVELAIDSAPTQRSALFRALLDNDGSLKTTEIERLVNCSKTTALTLMEQLRLLKLCVIEKQSHGLVGEPEKTARLTDNLRWFTSSECRLLRSRAPIDKGNLTLWDAGKDH
jgi:hypothetical protein